MPVVVGAVLAGRHDDGLRRRFSGERPAARPASRDHQQPARDGDVLQEVCLHHSRRRCRCGPEVVKEYAEHHQISEHHRRCHARGESAQEAEHARCLDDQRRTEQDRNETDSMRGHVRRLAFPSEDLSQRSLHEDEADADARRQHRRRAHRESSRTRAGTAALSRSLRFMRPSLRTGAFSALVGEEPCRAGEDFQGARPRPGSARPRTPPSPRSEASCAAS